MAEISPLQAYMAANQKRIDQLSQPQQQGLDPLMMLAVAQGFLSPTRTGGFGESLGNAAGMAVGPLSKARQADQDRMDKIDKLRETQVRLTLEQQRINDLNARAAAGYDRDPSLVYGTSMTGLTQELKAYPNPDELIGLDQSTPEGKAQADFLRTKRANILQAMETQRQKLLGGGARPSSDAGASRPVDTEEETPSRRQAPANAEPGFQNSAMPQAGGRRAAPSGAAAAAPAGRAGRIASDTDLENARTAYKQGAPIQAILKRFKENGITGITAEDITSGK